MLTLQGEQVESLWDEVLPIEARELPDDLARLDRVLSDPALLGPVAAAWERSARDRGRPSIAIATFVRLMVVKQRTGWGYETLVREVSDSLHLRRFCLIAIDQRVPDESTVRKLARRLGAEVVQEITRVVIAKARRETRFRGRAARIDSTVVEADIGYPTDATLALDGARALAREGKKVAAIVTGTAVRVRDRSRSLGRAVRRLSKTRSRRTGEATAQVMALNEQAGRIVARSAREARRLAAQARAAARGRGAQAKRRAAAKLEQLAARCEKLAEQIDRRARGLKITDRVVSIADPDARPIRKGKLGKPTEFGYVAQICEVTEHTRRGARGLSSPPVTRRATRPRTGCCPRPPQSSTAPASGPTRSSATAASCPARPRTRSPTSPTSRSNCPAATSRGPAAPASAARATGPAPRAASATSSAATACAAHA
jgi:transposase, IS5 family